MNHSLDATTIRQHLEELAVRDPAVRTCLRRFGLPTPRSMPPGYNTLLRALISQQVSVAAANGIYRKLSTVVDIDRPASLLAASDDDLRAGGLSRQKIGYARALATAIVDGALDFSRLPTQSDDDAIATISSIHGFGRWSAEVYLMFAEGRPDIFPGNDLGVQEGLRRILSLRDRPSEGVTRALGEMYAPHRSALSLFTWHVYANSEAQ
jgi:DNA-3-methyladenine glycosylase II